MFPASGELISELPGLESALGGGEVFKHRHVGWGSVSLIDLQPHVVGLQVF